MQSIQLCGPQLPAPKLNIQRSAPPPPEIRAASRRAADVIASIDRLIGEPCVYCRSGLYEEIPPGGCPACGGSGVEQGSKDRRYRREQRAKPGDRPPFGAVIEYTTGRIIGVR